MTLKESLLKNIHQSDNDIRKMYKDWIDVYGQLYFKRDLVENADYTLSKGGVLDFLPKVDGESIVGAVHFMGKEEKYWRSGIPFPPKGLRIGRLQRNRHSDHSVGVILSNSDLRNFDDIFAPSFESEYLSIKQCSLPKKLDLSKTNVVQLSLNACVSVEDIKLPKKMDKIDIDHCPFVKISGCEDVYEMTVNRVHWSFKFPKNIHNLSIHNSNLESFDQLPKEVGTLTAYNTYFTDDNLPPTQKRIENYCKYRKLKVIRRR